jgi:serine/threonine-protein kinase RsbW
MQRQILIIDDHDDIRSGLSREFVSHGHSVSTKATREEALALTNLEAYDLVITDLDNLDCREILSPNGSAATCLPTLPRIGESELPDTPDAVVKAFKICAAWFRRAESEGFDENELRDLLQTVLDYKARFVDDAETLQQTHEKIEFEVPSAIALMHTILDYLLQRVEKMGVADAENSNLFVALDEAFVNAVKHGNRFDPDKIVRITADISGTEVRFTIEDEGEGFNPNEIPDPLDPQNLFKASGRGVLLIHNIMDEVTYNERGNRLTMIKKKNAMPTNFGDQV